MTDEDLPGLYQAADAASLAGQRRYFRGLGVILGGALVAAAAGSIAGQDDHAWMAYVAGVAFLITILASLYLAHVRPERAWYDGRAVAESAKSLAWEYAVGGGPFLLEASAEADADDLLVKRLSDLVTKLSNLALGYDVGTAEQISARMRELRGSSFDARRAGYLQGRVDDQRSWYTGKARWNEKRNHQWLLVSLSAQGIGVLCAFLLGSGVIHVDALGLLAAVAAAIAGWVQAKDHASLARAYGVAAQELGLARLRLSAAETELLWAETVDSAEQAISREHTLWLARRGSALNVG